MRSARLVGLSRDGKSLVVATDSGEEMTIPADERLRAALRGDRPRLGQLEIEMESSLSPRDIQTRIRAGATLDDVARVAGMPLDRVERFAAPVLAEREHIASLAMSCSVRRKGETTGHRSLRITVTERLHGRGIDVDQVTWDSFRSEDGRWTVTADYRSGEAARHAAFRFDAQARFSVAANEEARWLLGEQSSAHGPQPGRRRPESAAQSSDTEPTLDLSDDLALVRATQDPEQPRTPPRAEAAEPTIAVPRRHLSAVAEPTGSDSAAAEPPAAGPAGLSDATAVPETPAVEGWEPAIVINYPVEPADDDSVAGADGQSGTDEPGPEQAPTDAADRSDEADELILEHEAEAAAPPPKPAARRKRASVPSWDEIMFGGPKRP